MGFRGVAVRVVAVSATLGVVACSSSSSPAAQTQLDAGALDSATDSLNVGPGDAAADGGAVFAGDWKCIGTQSLTFTTPTNTPPTMGTASSFAVTIATTATGLAATFDGCTFTLTVSGDTAAGSPAGQMCATGSILQNHPQGSADATYTAATMTLMGPMTMTFAGAFAFTDSALLGDGGRELFAGTGTYMSTCTKQ